MWLLLIDMYVFSELSLLSMIVAGPDIIIPVLISNGYCLNQFQFLFDTKFDYIIDSQPTSILCWNIAKRMHML